MATAPRLGLNPARMQGSGVDNKGLTEYDIASGYATALGIGDPVKLDIASGTIVRAENGDVALGVFHGCYYVDATGTPQYQKYWPAGQVSQVPPTALVMDNVHSLYNAKADGPIENVVVGDIYALNLTAPNAAVGHSTVTVATTAFQTGAEDISASADLGADITNLDDADAFNISSSVANDVVTITIGAAETAATLLAQINNVEGLSAALTVDGFLRVTATDGGDIVLVDGVGTPLADSNLLVVAGTYPATVAVALGMVVVTDIVDLENRILEVDLLDGTEGIAGAIGLTGPAGAAGVGGAAPAPELRTGAAALTAANIAANIVLGQMRYTLASATGVPITLPPATGSGVVLEFFVGLEPTSNGYVFDCDSTGVLDRFDSRLTRFAAADAAELDIDATSAGNHNRLTILNGGAGTGGEIGDVVRITDYMADHWLVEGKITAGAVAPFSSF